MLSSCGVLWYKNRKKIGIYNFLLLFLQSMLNIGTDELKLALHEPGDGFYRGTRFDRGGVFDSLRLGPLELCGRWFEHYDPLMHDAVCGPAEEFAPAGFDAAAPGECFFKPGVGLLVRPDDAPYDRFRLYEIADPGEWLAGVGEHSVAFGHRIAGVYEYRKRIVLTGPLGFEIRHSITSARGLNTSVYNHNFFTFGKMEVGPSRHLDFPFRPQGTWRASYDCVGFTPAGIRFSRLLAPGESVYSGDIHQEGGAGMPYALSLRDGGVTVRIEGDVPVTHTVFWANHRIACLEPYNSVAAPAGGTFSWTIKYTFSHE